MQHINQTVFEFSYENISIQTWYQLLIIKANSNNISEKWCTLYDHDDKDFYFESNWYWYVALSTENQLIFSNKQNECSMSLMDLFLPFLFFSSINNRQNVWIDQNKCILFIFFGVVFKEIYISYIGKAYYFRIDYCFYEGGYHRIFFKIHYF